MHFRQVLPVKQCCWCFIARGTAFITPPHPANSAKQPCRAAAAPSATGAPSAPEARWGCGVEGHLVVGERRQLGGRRRPGAQPPRPHGKGLQQLGPLRVHELRPRPNQRNFNESRASAETLG